MRSEDVLGTEVPLTILHLFQTQEFWFPGQIQILAVIRVKGQISLAELFS